MAIDFTALNNACVLYYSMDNADISGSTILDLTPNNNDGTINGATTGAVGRLNEAISFDGSNDYIQTTNNFPHYDEFTVIGVFKYDSLTIDDTIIGKSTGDIGEEVEWWIDVYSDNLRFGYGDGSGATVVTSSSTLSSGNLYFFAVVWENNNQVKIYIDEQLDTVTSTTAMTSITAPLTIGSRNAVGSKWFDGEIDEVSMFNKALTLEEIEYFYNQGAPTSNQQYPFFPNVVYEITGQVTLSGTATQGATLRLYDQTEGTYEGSTTTDVSGNYLFENLNETNEYHVSVEYDDETTKYNDESKPYVTPTEQ